MREIKLYFLMFWVLFLFLVVTSCSEKKLHKWEASIKTVGNVTYVHNPDKPRDGIRIFTLEEELSIGNEEDDNQLFIKVRSFTVDKNKNIYIPENKLHCIRIFDADGKFIRSFGSKGRGPGDFDYIATIAVDDKGIIHVLDLGNRKISKFNLDGSLISEFRLRSDVPALLLMDDKGFYNVFYTSIDEKNIYSYQAYKLNPSGEELKQSLLLMYRKPTVIKQGKIKYTSKTGYDPIGFFALLPDGELAYGNSEKYKITVYNHSYEERLVITRDAPEAKAITSEEKKNLISGCKTSYKKKGICIQNMENQPFPEKHRVLEDMWVNEDGNILVNRSIEGNKAEIDVFNSNGLYIEKWVLTNIPGGLSMWEILKKPVFFSPPNNTTIIYSLVKNDNDLIQVKRYRMKEKG